MRGRVYGEVLRIRLGLIPLIANLFLSLRPWMLCRSKEGKNLRMRHLALHVKRGQH